MNDKQLILVVDDDPDLVESVSMKLESEGFAVDKAYDGVEAWDRIKAQRPALVILDVMMPRLDGWATLTQMQADERFREIPVLMLTALKEPVNVKTGIDLGCTWYYTKPITDYPDFALVIARIIAGLEAPPAEVEDW